MPRPTFPRNLPEFFRMFPDEKAALRFVVESRWPEGAGCPKCGSENAYPRKDRLGGLECAGCGHTFSATAGTVMEGTKLPLSTWLQAAYLMVTDKRGISAKQLQRDLGLRGYETAYTLLQRLRAAMVNPDRERLHGAVEVDETFVGGVRHGKKGKEMRPEKEGKFVIVGAVETRHALRRSDMKEVQRPARLRLRYIPDKGAANLMRFVTDVIEPGTTIWTDANPSYAGIDRLDYTHLIQSTTLGMPQDAVLPALHLAFSNLKTWLGGTFHGRVGAKHLQGYLNEFCFRFNRRDNLYAAFQTVLGIAGKVKGPTHHALYDSGPGRFIHPNPHEGRAPYG